MRRGAFIAAVIGAAVSVTGIAALADGGRGGDIRFETLDSDGSGEISRAEMAARAAARFAEADTDKDGSLSEAEIAAHSQRRASARAAAMIARFDTDGDGALALAELPQPGRGARMFDRMDRDGSGAISREEFDAMQARAGHRGRGHKPAD